MEPGPLELSLQDLDEVDDLNGELDPPQFIRHRDAG